MSSFISQSACRGVHPKHINPSNYYLREALITKLMSQRNVLRIISAPNGFGKSVLAAQYANVVFSFIGVFWINCKSPCFIRDLDSNEIVNQIIQLENIPKLIIFDDLDLLSEDRVLKLSNIIDELLEYDCEVIATAAPYIDYFKKLQTDALILSQEDLLIDKEEHEQAKKDSDNTNFDDASSGINIPILYWGGNNGITKLLELFVKEELPSSIVFSVFYIYSLVQGSLNDLKNYLSKAEFKLLISMNKQYLYFGIDSNNMTFSVKNINFKKLTNIFFQKNNLIYEFLSCSSKHDVAEILANNAIKNNMLDRAFEIVKVFGSQKNKLLFLKKYNIAGIKEMFISQSCELFEKTHISRKEYSNYAIFQAWRIAILGLNKMSSNISYNVLDDKNSSKIDKLAASILFMRYGTTREKRQAIKIIRYLINDFNIDSYFNDENNDKEYFNKDKIMSFLTKCYLTMFLESKNVFDFWNKKASQKISLEHIIAASCILSTIHNINYDSLESESISNFLSIICRHLSQLDIENFDYFYFSLIDSYMNAIPTLANIEDVFTIKIDKQLLDLYKIKKKNLEEQKTSYIEKSNNQLIYNYEYSENFADSFNGKNKLNDVVDQYNKILNLNIKNNKNIPLMKICVFGGLTISFGDKVILQKCFTRQRTKLLLCILVLENGRELNKSKISEIIWPDSDEVARSNNINAHWSCLCKTLSLNDGSCPYLIRNQNSYSLNKQYVKTDLQDLEHLCADMTMGAIDSQFWWENIDKNDNIFNGDLLPSENKNSLINRKRIEYKNKVVDAFIAASNRLFEAGELQQSLWFAHKAISRDSSREDAYLALMRGQMEAGQRTTAMETYFACKNFLDSQLGIDPSQKINTLYKKLVSDCS